MAGTTLSKPAETRYPIHDLLRERWSPRAFADRPVDPETLGSLLEAARWAPSSRNEQPWRVIVATRAEPAAYARMFGCLKEGNQRWAGRAPVLLLAVAKLEFTEPMSDNRHAAYDVGQAMAHLSVQATALGLSVRQMGGFIPECARETYAIPAGFEPLAMLAIGYLDAPETLPDDLAERERAARTRKPFSAWVFAGTWGQAAPLADPGE
ncbi:MAG: nitroreductase [Chloroflexi bacterium]|nr:nitroreductase [Chloroflexota bacterium]